MTWEQEHALAYVNNALATIERAQKWIAQDDNKRLEIRTQRPLARAYSSLDTARLILEVEFTS